MLLILSIEYHPVNASVVALVGQRISIVKGARMAFVLSAFETVAMRGDGSSLTGKLVLTTITKFRSIAQAVYKNTPSSKNV
jgi:hypothetical protein